MCSLRPTTPHFARFQPEFTSTPRLRHKVLFGRVFLLAAFAVFGITVPMRSEPSADKDATMGRPRGTTAGKIHLVVEAVSQPAPSDTSKADPRLVNLVRIVARRAARDFVQAEMDAWKRDRLPE